MVDPQRVVESIRGLLYSGQQPPLEALQALAADYAEACREVNRRLARCEDFLRQGLRAEAIHYAQDEPNVLDVLAVLDFVERAHWDQLLAASGLPTTPLFRIETAAALNRAYAEAQPLEHLLRQHRLLALARAPLAERLAVLRQLAQHDAANPVWQQDAAAFETARLRQLREEVEALQRQPQVPPLEQVQGLLQEVEGGPWRVGMPPELVATLQEMVRRVGVNHWQVRLQELARDLAAAYQRKDEARARPLAEEWRQALQQAPLPNHDPRWAAALPALRWLERLEQQRADAQAHQQALEALQQALHKPNVREGELEQLFLAVARAREGAPKHLEEAYQRRMGRLRSSRLVWERLILATVTALALMAVVGFLLYLLNRG
jgi:hypothetical protein